MRKDPIIEEIHAIREEMAREAGYDLHEIARQARQQREALGERPVVKLPPRRPSFPEKMS